MSRPREDKIRALATTLRVDEVWLALARKPGETPAQKQANAVQAHGAVLLVAGPIEVKGGRVTFPSEEEATPHSWANLNGAQFGVVAVAPQSRDGQTISFIIPEPIGPHRVLGVIAAGLSLSIDLLDLTDVKRQNHGGFRIVTLEARKGNKFKAPDPHNLLAPLASVADLTA
ncbi:hypothetical protein AIOL_000249 [Candidatus Rhodobacter oscarellae]|uniref:Uncharacterized protein n=2 Tax=Candidatus Rhodobacter oscarellae TaxID=1675527 RepID=A0A0J9EBF4_9RHOB|nr:hypothetical protein AIOL_000249 [Candidatus Rhodobacter lobularis]